MLACGHVVCARPGGWLACPAGCVGPGGTLAVCGLIDNILRSLGDGYEEALLQGCGATPTPDMPSDSAAASANEAGAWDSQAMIAQAVELHSLTSEAGRQLNGQQGTVESWDEDAGRLAVVLSGGRKINVRPGNARLLQTPTASESYVHFGVGCDGCGVFPIVGRRFCCADCSEAIGYDLCDRCYDTGLHKREAPSGRFNQAHKPEHRMEEIEQVDTWLHRLQRAHPELTPEQIMGFVQAHSVAQEDDEEANAHGGGEGDS